MQLYDELADWWPLLSAPEEYEEEAGIYGALLEEACDGPIDTLLELGSGGGSNAFFMKRRFGSLTLTDVAPRMLELSRELNPECGHILGDMRDVRLDREYDAVFVHDAVCYMATEDDVRRAIETARVHCRPGGALLFAPDYLRETFRPSTEEGGHDEKDPPAGALCPRALRYLAWVFDPDPTDTEYVTDYAYLLRGRDGEVRAVYERHREGLFSRELWLGLFDEAGFDVRQVPLEHSDVEPGVHEMFVGRRR